MENLLTSIVHTSTANFYHHSQKKQHTIPVEWCKNQTKNIFYIKKNWQIFWFSISQNSLSICMCYDVNWMPPGTHSPRIKHTNKFTIACKKISVMIPLQSVLQQQATSNFNCECNFSSPQAALNEAITDRTNNNTIPSSEIISSSSSTTSSSKTNRSTSNQRGNQLNKKRQGVSGESCNAKSLANSTDILISKHEKDFK